MVYAVGLEAGLELISLRQLLLFEAAGRLGYITEAAHACQLSQPAATQALQQLQDHLGLALMERGTKGCCLTPWGAAFHADITLWLGRLQQGLGIKDLIDLWHITPRQMRALSAIAQRGSVDLAAATLGVTPRSVLRMIQALEQRIGCSLLQAKVQGPLLSEAGQQLARTCETLLGELRLAASKAYALHAQHERRLSIAVMGDPGFAAIGKVVREHLAHNPQSCLRLKEASAPELLTQLLIGEIDLIFGSSNLPTPPGLLWKPIDTSRFVIAASHSHPLAGRDDVSLDELACYDWIDAAEDSQRHSAFTELFAGRAAPRIILIGNAPPLTAQILAQSDHLGLMTEYELSLRTDQLCALPSPKEISPMQLAYAQRVDWQPPANAQDLLQRARQLFASKAGS